MVTGQILRKSHGYKVALALSRRR